MGDIVIRDVSRVPTKEWVPPIGAMGGPPAHELYRDLVLRAGLRLFRDHRGHPYLALKDGEHRRTFRVPSLELREALDRFRMGRNLRLVPETELIEFARVVAARVSDPDIFVPTLEADRPWVTDPDREVQPPSPVREDRTPRAGGWEEEISSLVHHEEEVTPVDVSPGAVAKVPSAWNDVVDLHPAPALVPEPVPPSPPAPVSLAVSGAHPLPPPEDGLLRYVTALRALMDGREWVGTTAELSHVTGETPETVFAHLRAYRSELVRQDIVVAPVETRAGWRWLAVDASRFAAPSR